MNEITISSRVVANGFQTIIGKKKITTRYPRNVWESVPAAQKSAIAETVSYFATRHMGLSTKKKLFYQFAPPVARLMYDYGLFYSMVEAPFEFPEKHLSTADILKSVYNAEFTLAFRRIPKPHREIAPLSLNSRTSLMPISFGKDSLTTFALARELGLHPHPIFFMEPACPYQNKKKLVLRDEFQKEFGTDIAVFSDTLGNLRSEGGMMWGWDMLLTQYTTLLLPFVYSVKQSYFFWSNEKSTDESAINREGYIINSTHEQSVQWMLHLNNLFRSFGINTVIGSLLEPIHELMILSILHKRYPEIGKYQLSCDGERTKHRWCGKCFECARVFLFLTALGIDPKRVGLMDNMFDKRKRSLFYLFDKKDKGNLDIVFQSYPERLLAFYLCFRRGVRGGLMEEFIKQFLPFVTKQKTKLFTRYIAVHDSLTVPDPIKKPLFQIYREELDRFKKELT